MLLQHHFLCIVHAPVKLLLKLLYITILRCVLHFIVISICMVHLYLLLILEHLTAELNWRCVLQELVESDVFARILIFLTSIRLLAAAEEPLRWCQTTTHICGLNCAQKLRVAICADQCSNWCGVCIERGCLQVGKHFV